MINLFPDQQKSINALRAAMQAGYKNIVLQGETGSGKSIMGSSMISASQDKGFKSAFIVPRKDLLFQMNQTFEEFGIKHSFIAQQGGYNPFSKTHLCTVGTLANRLNDARYKLDHKLVFIDECHYGAGQLEKIISHYQKIGSYVIGLSASPEKTDGRGLDEYYDHMIVGPTIAELIKLKRLSDYRLFAPSRPDFSGIKIVNGDYAKNQISEKMEEDQVLVGDAVKHYKEHAMGKLNITFCTSIKHSEMVAEKFRAAGIPTMHIDGETPDAERRRIARAFANRELLNLCSVDLMTFGYDLAAASGVKNVTIESMSDLRPTKSRPLQRQKNGRVLRYKNYPALIFDHSGNYRAHGLPDDKIEWTLAAREKRNRSDEEEEVAVRIKQCEKCDFVHPPAPKCPNCGNVYEIKSREVDEVDGELFEIDRATLDARHAKEVKKSMEALISIGYRNKVKDPIAWAARKFSEQAARRAK